MKRVTGASRATSTSAGRSAAWSPARRAAPTALALLMAIGLVAAYALYLRSDDIAPDSAIGYACALGGTALLTLVGVGYAVRKRLRRNWAGLLHTALRWHIAGGALALLLILMHSAGNFHPRTGTYALYGLIALVASGIVGKALDRVAPHLAARAARTTLTHAGEDRLEALAGELSGKLPAVRASQDSLHDNHGKQKASDNTPWDLAYYDLSVAPGAIPDLLRSRTTVEAPRTPRPVVKSKRAMASESAAIQHAMRMERLFLHLVRVWRYLHTALSVVTLGLILWHLEFAATLLLGK